MRRGWSFLATIIFGVTGADFETNLLNYDYATREVIEGSEYRFYAYTVELIWK